MIMKYLFGDTTDFPPQRDFLKLPDRNEIYPKKSVAIDKLYAVKDKGKKLSEILGIG